MSTVPRCRASWWGNHGCRSIGQLGICTHTLETKCEGAEAGALPPFSFLINVGPRRGCHPQLGWDLSSAVVMKDLTSNCLS